MKKQKIYIFPTFSVGDTYPLILFKFCFVLSICTVRCIDFPVPWSTILEKGIHMLLAVF